jgi:hypothetical protein
LATGSQRFWIVEGQRLPPCAAHELDDSAERDRFERMGGVRVTTGALGTEIKWSAFSPCFASLYHLLNWLPEAAKPFVLRYYLCGWFEEFADTVEEVRERIEQVIVKSEIRITRKAFVEQQEPDVSRMPETIRTNWNTQDIVPAVSIDCSFDHRSQKFRVTRVGERSLIARIYGAVPVIYPYVNGGSYEEIVTEAYREVLGSGVARYDHVLAAMRMPNNAIHWLPYQRVIVPRTDHMGSPAVTVVTEVSRVSIRPV